MKFTQVLLIMLIGMISLTAFSTTREPARKPETTLVRHHFDAVAVVNVEATNFQMVNTIVGIEVVSIAAEKEKLTLNRTQLFYNADDVGWHSSIRGKALTKSNIKHTHIEYVNPIISITDIRIRDGDRC